MGPDPDLPNVLVLPRAHRRGGLLENLDVVSEVAERLVLVMVVVVVVVVVGWWW